MLCRTPRDIIHVTLRLMSAQSQTFRRAGRIQPQILNLLMMQHGNPLLRRTDTTIVPRHTGDAEEVRGDGDRTGNSVMGGGEER